MVTVGAFLNSFVDGNDSLDWPYGHYISAEIISRTLSMGGWLEFRMGLEAEANGNSQTTDGK
jgi:hypothetical protein